MNRREFLAASAAGAAMLQQGLPALGQAAPTAAIEVAIDAARIGAPITPLIFGGYMEPATTLVWAEMLTDRKFYHPVTNTPAPPQRPFFRMGGKPWRPVGPEGTVEMDTAAPLVGSHSPRVRLAGDAERGIGQAGLRMAGGKAYTGYVYLAGDTGASVEVRLVWGPGPHDSQTFVIPNLSSLYRKFPIRFLPKADTTDGRLEIVGTGSGSFRIGAVSLMPADNMEGFHAGMIKLYRDAGFKMAKWPGGNFVSGYNWYDGIGDRDQRPPRPQAMWGNRIESNDVGIHEFIAFCRLLGAEPYIAVNSGFGDARGAAEEVEYCNGSVETRLGKLRAANGDPEPFKVRLWCIGNEMYGWWQFGHMTLDQYWVKHNEFAVAMKKVDPTIQVSSSGASICEKSWCDAEQRQWGGRDPWRPALDFTLPHKFGGTHDWDGWLLARCADHIDHVSEHTYCYPDFAFNAGTQRFEPSNDALQFRARRGANRMGEFFDAWQHYTEKMPALKQKGIKFIFDEWGTRFRSPTGGFAFNTGMESPLAYALFLHEMFRHSDMVAASCPTAGLFQVLINKTGEAVGLPVSGLVMKLMANHLAGALPVAVGGNSPQQPVKGTPFVDIPTSPIGSPTYPLDVVAALSADRKTLILSVVNPTESGQAFSPQLTGATLGGAGKLWQIAAPTVKSANRPDSAPEVQIVESSVPGLGASVPAPKLSISVYEFPVG